MVEAIVAKTVAMLGNMLMQEASFLSGVKNHVQNIRDELKTMQCFLKDAEKRQHKDERIRNWVRSVRNLAHKTEDIIETYATKVESRKGRGIEKSLKRFACIFDEWVNLYKLGLDIENIKTQVANLTTSLQTYDIKMENEGQSSNLANKDLLRQTFPHDIEEHFVGMQNDIDTLVQLLVDGDKSHRIISIYGMGGSGKTTLAKEVFNHKDVQNCFESFAWVTISQQLKAETVLQEILGQLDRKKGRDEIKIMEYRELVQQLCQVQREKKCLVVLDDIWNKEDWTILRHAFLEDADKCKVLLTTRKEAVAKIGSAHKLNLLNEEEGWQLLKKKALVDAEATGHEKMGKEMVHKCGYLPLAISVIGGILARKRTLEEWETVNNDIDSYLRFGDGIEDNQQIMQILDLSYDDLPYQLKPCLLYFASCPEDFELDLEDLCWKLIGEDMVLSKDKRKDETLTDVAERYLNELAGRSLIQVRFLERFSTINPQSKSYRLHDLMRDLCLRKCQEEEFLNFMDFRGKKRSVSHFEPLVDNAYRFVIYGAQDDTVAAKVLQEANKNTRLYSLRHIDTRLLRAQELSKNLGSLQFLRVVELEGLEFLDTKLLRKAIKMLIHVRFLSFIKCRMNELPSSIAKLPYLQTLSLISFSGEVKVTNMFMKLKSLIHLVLLGVDFVCESKQRLDSLNRLETLVHDNLSPIEFKSLSALKSLRIFTSVVMDNDSLSRIINHIEHNNWPDIRHVRLVIDGGCDFINTAEGSTLLYKLFVCLAVQQLIISNVCIRELPRYESGMLASSRLLDLVLNHCQIENDPIPTLEKLPKLKSLMFFTKSYVGEELICSSNGFPNLVTLVLSGLQNLRKWVIEEGAMPNLSELKIEDCPGLEMIPNGMKFLKDLKKLEIIDMPEEFNNNTRNVNGEEGADFHKVRHVPVISIS